MRRILGTALLVLSLSLAAFASGSVDFTFKCGVLTGSNAGLNLSGSELTAVSGLNGLGTVKGDLGTVSFTTGSLSSGTLKNGGTFDPGGSFVIKGDGSDGMPNGVIFQGTFVGTSTWTMTTSNGTHVYTLQATISGTWYNGVHVKDATITLTVSPGTCYVTSGGKYLSTKGMTSIPSPVPEPGTLGLLGTGLVGLAGVLNRRRKA
jgi:hypothetical protein